MLGMPLTPDKLTNLLAVSPASRNFTFSVVFPINSLHFITCDLHWRYAVLLFSLCCKFITGPLTLWLKLCVRLLGVPCG